MKFKGFEMLVKRVMTLLIIFGTLQVYSQDFREDFIDSLISEIIRVDIVMGPSVGYSGEKPIQYKSFEKLTAFSTVADLKELTTHKSPVIRSYAFWALASMDSLTLDPIILSYLSDTSKVNTMFGCLLKEEKLNDFIVTLLRLNRYGLSMAPLEVEERYTIDSLILNGDYLLDTRDSIFDRIPQNSEYYNLLKKLAINGERGKALIKLLSYRNEDDISYVSSYITDHTNEDRQEYLFKLISEFPHPSFFKYLDTKKGFVGKLSVNWFNAVAAYKTENASTLLNEMLNDILKKKDQKIEKLTHLFSALKKNRDDVYTDLLFRLWEEEGLIDMELLKFLYNKDATRATKCSHIYIKRIDYIFDNYMIDHFGMTDFREVTTTILTIIKHNDESNFNQALECGLRSYNISVFDIFGGFVQEAAHKSHLHLLLKRFVIEKDNLIKGRIKSLICTFDNININNELLSLKRKQEIYESEFKRLKTDLTCIK